MNIRILQCDNRKWTPVGSLIKLVQGTDYSHYAIQFFSDTGNSLVLDATSANVSTRHPKYYTKQYKIVRFYTIELNCKYVEFASWYENLLGEHYGYAQLIGILLKSRKLGKGIICNELVLRLLNRFSDAKIDVSKIDIMDLNQTEKVIKEVAI